MRNLKRALSLALASVMLMGMMVVGTSAAGFPDVDAQDNVEAIEVAQAIKVMVGDENGNFNPDQKVTRAEMATVITKLLALKSDDFKGTTKFTDVPAWADGFVGACYAAGIIKGYSETAFGSNDGVKAVDAGLMVMKALGYFQYESDFEDNYVMAAVKQASKIELFKGIDAGVEETLTRNEVAQLVLNALKADMVEATDNGIGLDTKGNLVSKYKYDVVTKNVDVKWNNIDATMKDGKSIVQLGESLYEGKLIFDENGATDGYGRTANEWFYGATTEVNDNKIGDYVNETADFVLTATKDNKSVQYWVESIDKDFVATNVRFNGTDSASASVQLGAEIEVYLDTNGDVEKVIVNTYDLVQLTKVTAATNKDYAYTVKFNGKTWTDDKLPGFDAKTMVKDAYVLVLYNQGASKVLDITVPEYVEGKITEVGSGYIKIDGTKYPAVAYTANYDNTYKFYLDANGNVMGQELVTEASTSDGYVYLLSSASKAYAGSTLGIGGNAAAVKVKVAYMDGTQETLDYVINKASAAIAVSATCPVAIAKDAYYIEVAGVKYEVTGTGAGSDMASLVANTFYAYTKDENGKIVLKALDADIDAEVSASVIEDSTAVATGFTANSATKVVVIDTTNKKTAEYVGFKNFPKTAAAGDALVVHAKNSTVASTVYIIGTVTEDNVTYAYATGSSYTNNDGTFYQFVVDGVANYYETTTVPTDGSVYTLTYNAGTKDWTIGSALETAGIVSDIDDHFVVTSAGATVQYADAYKVWDLTGDEIVAGEIADGDCIKYVTSSGKLKVAFVVPSFIVAQPETRAEAQEILDYAAPYDKWYLLPTLGLAQNVDGHEVSISGKLTAVNATNYAEYDAAIEQYLSRPVADFADLLAQLAGEGWDMANVTAIGFVVLEVDGTVAVTALVNQAGNVRCLKNATTTLNWMGVEFDFAGLSF